MLKARVTYSTFFLFSSYIFIAKAIVSTKFYAISSQVGALLTFGSLTIVLLTFGLLNFANIFCKKNNYLVRKILTKLTSNIEHKKVPSIAGNTQQHLRRHLHI